MKRTLFPEKLHFVLIMVLALFIGLVGKAQVQAADTIKIASIFAKSGDAAASNLHHFQAVRFAVDEINKKGGLLGKKIELLEFDNYSTPIQSKLAARKAVKAKVDAVIGCAWSSHSIAMASTLQKAKIPMITPDSTNPKVTKKGNYIFRACFIDPFQGEVLARFAKEDLKAETAVVVTKITSAYSLGLGEMFAKYFKQGKGNVLAELEYKDGQKEFSSIVAQVKKLSPDVLFIPGHDESGFIVKQALDASVPAIMLGGDGWAYQQFYSNGGQELKEGYYTNHWSRELDNVKTKEFVASYRKVYELNDFAAVTYDAVMLLADAINRAKSTDRAKIRDALANTKNFEGVTGNISLNEAGDPAKQIVIMKIVNGKAIFSKAVGP